MGDAKWCCENINSGDIRFKNVLGEVKELLYASSYDNIKEEIGDVIYFWNCWLYCRFKINLPMIGAMDSIYKFIDRLIIWDMIFAKHNLDFKPKYLINGSNYNKPEKIEKALELARRDQNES